MVQIWGTFPNGVIPVRVCITLWYPHHICLDILDKSQFYKKLKSLVFFILSRYHNYVIFLHRGCRKGLCYFYHFCQLFFYLIKNISDNISFHYSCFCDLFFRILAWKRYRLYKLTDAMKIVHLMMFFFFNLPLLLHIQLLEASQIPHIAWDSGWHTEWILWMCLQTTGTKDSWLSTSWCRPVERNAEHKQPVRVHWITCGIFRVQRVYWCKLQWQHPLSLLYKGKYPITLQETNTFSAFIL